jgi:hypothetical protein
LRRLQKSFQSDVQEARGRGSGDQYKGNGREVWFAPKEVKVRIAEQIRMQ